MNTNQITTNIYTWCITSNHWPIWGLNLHKLNNIDNLLWKIPFESPPKNEHLGSKAVGQ